MPNVVMDQHAGTGRTSSRTSELVDVAKPLSDALAAGNHASRSNIVEDLQGIVHDHDPPGPVVVYLAFVTPVAVMVPDLRIATGRIVVQHAMRVHHVVRTEYARQPTAHNT